MELRQLSTFIRVAQLKNFSKAAESLGYSQSAVTVQIRQLEEELNVRLFDRIGRRVTLTSPGAQFLEHAYEVIHEVNRAKRSLSNEGDLHGSLRIGVIESLCSSQLPGVLHSYWEQHPHVLIHVTTGEPEELIAQMEGGDLDLIYILDEPRYNNNWCKLMELREEIVFVASAVWGPQLQRDGPIELAQLLDKPFFLTEQEANYRRVLDRLLAARRSPITPFLECRDTSFLIKMLEVHCGISFLPWYVVKDEVQQGRLAVVEVNGMHVSLYRQIFCHREKWRTKEMDEFVRLVEEIGS